MITASSKNGVEYILHAAIIFNTPGGPSDFVIGCSANGWIEWKEAGGKKIDEIFGKKEE
ncbi:MAG: DUF4357 domain-containing protein [Clostridia bacterium]|nr:DUF4357 domain-containing protein [Clostridia bacterium]